jgi:hypothetical protein
MYDILYNSCQLLYVCVCEYVIRQPLGWRRWVGCAYRRVGYHSARTRDCTLLDSEGARARACGPRCRLLVWHGAGATVGGPRRRSYGQHSAPSQLPPHDRTYYPPRRRRRPAAATTAAVTRYHRRTPSPVEHHSPFFN